MAAFFVSDKIVENRRQATDNKNPHYRIGSRGLAKPSNHWRYITLTRNSIPRNSPVTVPMALISSPSVRQYRLNALKKRLGV